MTSRSRISKKPDCLSICLVTAPWKSDCGGYTFRSKLTNILNTISDNLTVITGNYPINIDLTSNIRIRNVVSTTQTKWFILRFLKNIQIQFILSFNMLLAATECDVILIMSGGGLIFPVLTARLLRKKTAYIISGVSGTEVYKMARMFYSRNLFGLGRIFIPGILSYLESFNKKLCQWTVYEVRPDSLADKDVDAIQRSAWGPLNIDNKFLKPVKVYKERENLIGFVGRLSQEKGILEFCKAIPLILSKRPDLKFRICGSGEYYDCLDYELIRSGYRSWVEFTGLVPYGNLPEQFGDMKLLVLPSYMEGLPNVLLEAMACGVPVLATPVGAIPDIIRDNVTGFLLKNNTPEQIAESVLNVICNPRLYEISSAARDYAEKEFSLVIVRNRYKCILKRIYNENRKNL